MIFYKNPEPILNSFKPKHYMTFTDQDIRSSLKKYFGFESFKGDQSQIVRSVLDGRNTFVIMPTGGGKSLCYQLPAMMMPGTTIIISP